MPECQNYYYQPIKLIRNMFLGLSAIIITYLLKFDWHKVNFSSNAWSNETWALITVFVVFLILGVVSSIFAVSKRMDPHEPAFSFFKDRFICNLAIIGPKVTVKWAEISRIKSVHLTQENRYRVCVYLEDEDAFLNALTDDVRERVQQILKQYSGALIYNNEGLKGLTYTQFLDQFMQYSGMDYFYSEALDNYASLINTNKFTKVVGVLGSIGILAVIIALVWAFN